MKKKILVVAIGAIAFSALVAGCKTKEFSSTPFYAGNETKFTGAVE